MAESDDRRRRRAPRPQKGKDSAPEAPAPEVPPPEAPTGPTPESGPGDLIGSPPAPPAPPDDPTRPPGDGAPPPQLVPVRLVVRQMLEALTPGNAETTARIA